MGVATVKNIGKDWIDYWSTPPRYPTGKDDVLNNVGRLEHKEYRWSQATINRVVKVFRTQNKRLPTVEELQNLLKGEKFRGEK